MNLIHMSLAGPEHFITDAKGNRWKFEMHSYCGPIVLGIDGDPMDTQPGPKSPFWHAVTRWAQGGHRLSGIDCIWEEEVLLKIEHIVGKHYRVVA
jgi:hypothetical protein